MATPAPPPAITTATLQAAYASVGIVTSVGLTGGFTLSTFFLASIGNVDQPFEVLQIPTETFDLELDGTQTNVTSDASFWNGRTWSELSPGEVTGTAKFEVHWTAEAPFYPPQLLTNYTYGFIFYYLNPALLIPAQSFGILQNCAIFCGMIKKSPLHTDRKSGVTSWKVDMGITGPVVYRAGDGTIIGF